MTSPRRRIRISRNELRALLDAVNPATSPPVSLVWERLLDAERASAEIEIVIPAIGEEV